MRLAALWTDSYPVAKFWFIWSDKLGLPEYPTVYITLNCMPNTFAHASKWTHFLASRAEFPAGERLLAAFHIGKVTRLCECGCNSFDIEVPDGAVAPLAQPGDSGGSVFELEFRTTEEQGTLEFIVLVGSNGHLAGIEVDYCANSYPVPDEIILMEPPYHVRASASLAI
ncbi:hypothetical protein [Polaromonas sp.]|uniref:hypothetical protein n=1 Tax=Polaromonas sp. TaxID=1869339 RepID=UPI002FC9D369